MSDTQQLSMTEFPKRETDNTSAVFETSSELSPETSIEIPSTVQITLAKRILLAGTDRILLLGARTSVPINDDERASVSDLTLRLSDGTNVALSLSFFNDDAGNIIPFRNFPKDKVSMGRVTFEPLRYAFKDESKLGAVLVSMAVLVIGAVYLVMPDAFGNLIHPNKSSNMVTTYFGHYADKAKIEYFTPKPIAPKSVAPRHVVSKTSPTKFKNASSKESLKPAFHVSSDSSIKSKSSARAPHAARTSPIAQSKRMFVPPPPPTEYVMPPANSPYWAQFTPAVSPVTAPLSIPRILPPLKRKENGSSNLTKPANQAALPVIRGASTETKNTAITSPASKENDPPPEPVWNPTNTMAPLPGNSSEFPIFERIIPPETLTKSGQ